MEQTTKIVSVAALPQVRVLGRTTGTDVVNLFWTGSGIEFIYTGSEIQAEVNADYDAYEPWLAVELNGVQISRVPLNKGKNEVCLFRGMTVGKPKHVRILKEVQAMHQDPGHLLQIVGLQYADGEFQQLPEPKYRLEFVGDSITSGEGTVGAVYEEDWISAFFSAMNTYPRMVADALSAEYRVVSQSGWGIVTGWDGNVENKIPPFYTPVCGLLTGERNASLGALEDYDFTVNVSLPDVSQQYMLQIKNGVVLVYKDTLSDKADVSVTCPKNALFYIITNDQENMAKTLKVEGNAKLVALLAENMNQVPVSGPSAFNIIEP